VKKLTSEILQEYVNKIVVHHRERTSIAGEDNPAAEGQTVEIFYNCAGKIEIPDLEKIPPIAK